MRDDRSGQVLEPDRVETGRDGSGAPQGDTVGPDEAVSGQGRAAASSDTSRATRESLRPDPERYDAARNALARARGLGAPYIAGGEDADPDSSDREN